MKYHVNLTEEETLDLRNKVTEKFEDIINLLQSHNNKIAPSQHIDDTPKRLAKMYVNELLKGCFTEPPKLTTFDNEHDHSPVIVKDIKVKSMCSHHFIPFIGNAVVFYLPKKKLVGLSKFSRIVNYFSRRPQVQEELTREISEYLNEQLQPKVLAIGIEAQHLCMSHRGAEDEEANMITFDIIINDEECGYSRSDVQKILSSNLKN